jgi:hypothetical protein
MPLPVSCDEASLMHLRPSTRAIYGFFLAEMSLRNIINQLLSLSDDEIWPRTSTKDGSELNELPRSPVAEEFDNQLSTWLYNVPDFLDWSLDHSPPVSFQGRRGLSDLASRLKMLYWFAQFLLLGGLSQKSIEMTAANNSGRLNGKLLHNRAVVAAVRFVEVFLLDDPEIDILMAHRYSSLF